MNVVLVAKPDDVLRATHEELQTAFPELEFRKVGKLNTHVQHGQWPWGLNSSRVQVPADLGRPGGYLTQIEEATTDIDVQLVFCNAGYVLAGFVEKRYASQISILKSYLLPSVDVFVDHVLLTCRTLEDLLANIECNSTSATAIAYHFCMQMVCVFC